MKYPAQFEMQDDGGYTITFRDIPEAISQADSIADARVAALDALVTALEFYFEDQRTVPSPSAAKDGEHLIALPPSLCAKVELLALMHERRVRPADLARRMHVKPQEVTRLMDLRHATKIDTIGAAFSALGSELVIEVREPAFA
ncbi:type II toxin-antitoxin system HicB family antitoxin [Paracidovorax konjaci]|uniref:type II toxin-antitoxin system HicB family antitoxin n=1 Tax=Paracidovorax konjaci TaxID=32040 RepID=UPI000B8214CB|nr:type II toxin-antitoxin system HicB family antitoxin [Paracidovorax konjaci]